MSLTACYSQLYLDVLSLQTFDCFLLFSGADFTAEVMSVVFTAGQSSLDFDVGALDDSTAEGVESFMAVIDSPTPLPNCALLVRITDDDGTY